MTSKELLEKLKQFTTDVPDFVQYEDGTWKFKTDNACLTTGDGGARMMLETFQELSKEKK